MIFIIVGIVLLFTFAGVLYLTKTIKKDTLTVEGDPIIQQVPQEFRPIQQFTEECLRDIATSGLIVLGQQGGYINPELVGEFSLSEPTDSDGLDLGGTKIPYWHYNKNKNEDRQINLASAKPLLFDDGSQDGIMSIEGQLERYIAEKLPECLDYSSFEGRGFTIMAEDERDVDVRIGEEQVGFLLKMPLTVTLGESSQDMDQYFVKEPLALKHYYDVAVEIADAEFNYSFLEHQTLNLISSFSGLDPEKLPPREATTFGPVPTAIWDENQVKEQLRRMLVSHVPMLRYLGATNFYAYEYQPSDNVPVDLTGLFKQSYDDFILPLDQGDDLGISFDYFGWEPYVDLNDRGGRIEPSSETVSYLKLQFTFHDYHITYDVTHPVLVTLHDPFAFEGRGYDFVFALESNVRNNRPVVDDAVLPLPTGRTDQSMFCDQGKRQTGLVKTIVLDSATKEPVSDVSVLFSIPDDESCVMGVTNNNGELSTTYPAVYGGMGSYLKQDYLSDFYPINTYDFKKTSGIIGYAVADVEEPAVQIHPYKLINVSVKRKDVVKCIQESGENEICFGQGNLFGAGGAGGVRNKVAEYQPELTESTHTWHFSNSVKSLTSHETATITLTRVGSTDRRVIPEEFVAVAAITGENTLQMELVPGVYTVSGVITTEEDLVIPKEQRCTDGFLDPLLCGDLDGCCFDFEENILDKSIVAQVQWEDPDQYLVITPEQLYASEEITLYMPGFDELGVPKIAGLRVLEDLQMMSEVTNISKHLRAQLEPTYR